MRKPLAAILAISSFAIGIVAAEFIFASVRAEEPGTESTWQLPVAAQRAWFPPATDYETDGEVLPDEKFDALMTALDEAMTAEETLADFGREADVHLMNFMRRLGPPQVSEEQQDQIRDRIDALAEAHPDHAGMINGRTRLLESYASPGGLGPLSGPMLIFDDVDDYDTGGDFFADATLDDMLARLDAALKIPDALADFENESGLHFWRFNGRLQRGRLTPAQVERVVAFYEEVKARHPESAESIDKEIYVVRNLLPGNVAPNIVGKDTDGVEFSLEEYRGKIVALIFSGQWCGPCRGEYPYHRFVLENYQDRPIVLLGINSDAKLETIQQAKIDENLPYRAWWDGHGQPDEEVAATKGPIATQWNVTGWPDIYILDEEGVIRFVGDRGGEFIAALDKLYMERIMREFEQGPADETEAATDN